MENKKNDTFQYTYSAEEQEEINRIRSKYTPKEESKMDQLKKLDASATKKATLYALIVGIVGTLILGTGMSCCMVWTKTMLIPGIIIGLVGIAIVSVTYPLYNHVLKTERDRIAPEILQLTDELTK